MDVIELRPLRVRRNGRPVSLGRIAVDPGDPELARLREDVERHNALAAAIPVEGCAPPCWRRLFRGCRAFGGHWHTAGAAGSYQAMPAADRTGLLRIGGEPVAEADVRASHLTVLHGLAGHPLPDRDPYAVEGFPREVVKHWITATLGRGSPARQWPKGAPAACHGLSSKALGKVLIARFPVLADPAALVPPDLAARFGGKPRPLLGHYLAGLEAAALTRAMAILRETRGVLALPLHDALIVPRSAVEAAAEALSAAYLAVAGIVPRLHVRGAEADASIAPDLSPGGNVDASPGDGPDAPPFRA